MWHWAPHSHHLVTVLGPAPCCLQSVSSMVIGELLPKAGTSFPRHPLKPLDQNSAVFLALNPAFLLFIMLDGRCMQMLYFGKVPGLTEKSPRPPQSWRQQLMFPAGAVGCLVGCQSLTSGMAGWRALKWNAPGERKEGVYRAGLSQGKAAEQRAEEDR